jgi:hypothetical protein
MVESRFIGINRLVIALIPTCRAFPWHRWQKRLGNDGALMSTQKSAYDQFIMSQFAILGSYI